MWHKIKGFLFRNKTAGQTIVKNTFWLSVSNFGGRFIRAAIIIYAARVLGPTQWGFFNYTITIVSFLTLFVDLGISQILIRDLARAKDKSEGSKLISTAFIIKMVLIALGVMVVLFVAPHLPTKDVDVAKGAANLFPIVVFILIFDGLREFGFAIVRAREKMELEALLFLFTNIAVVASGYFLLHQEKNVIAFAEGYAIGPALGAVGTGVALRKDLANLIQGFDSERMKGIFKAAWPFAISSILAMLMINTDIIMIGWLRSAQELGWYSAPQRIMQLLYLVPSILGLSVLPAFARFAIKNDQQMSRALVLTISGIFLFALPLAVGGVLVAPQLVPLIFGAGYIPATLSFQILLLTLLVDFPAVILSHAIFSYNHQRSLMIYSAIGGFTNVFFNLIFIPIWGIAGCALSTFLAQFLSNAYLWRKMRTLNNFQVLPRLHKGILATLVMAGAVVLAQSLGSNVVLTITLGALVFGGALLLLREDLIKEFLSILRFRNEDVTAHEMELVAIKSEFKDN